eukprot:COSAG01_NODE_1079_length_11822_cov_4.368762_12_plen_45_part_00
MQKRTVVAAGAGLDEVSEALAAERRRVLPGRFRPQYFLSRTGVT